jgi:hypothetical protein
VTTVVKKRTDVTLHRPARGIVPSSTLEQLSRANQLPIRMTCESCHETERCPVPGCLPWRWTRFEMMQSSGEKRRIYLCRRCGETKVPAMLRESQVFTTTIHCGVCKRTEARIGLDSSLPSGWMRLEVVIDAQVVYGQEQGCRMYFCPTCGPTKLPPLLASIGARS